MNTIADSFMVDGTAVGYETAGSGTPLLFVHGSAGSGKQWKRLYEHFSRTRQVFAYDLIGCGANRPLYVEAFHGDGAADERSFRYEDDARALLAAIDRFEEPADVIAHSAGATGALLAALERPAAIRSLTLFEPVPFVLLRDSGDPAFEPVRAIALEYRWLFERRGPVAALVAFVEFWNGEGAWQRLSTAARQSMLVGANRLYLEWGIILYGRSYLHADDLARLRQPVLYFCGARSIEPVKRLAEIAMQRLPYGRAVTVPGAGHMAPFTHATDVAAEIEAHLCGVSKAPGRTGTQAA